MCSDLAETFEVLAKAVGVHLLRFSFGEHVHREGSKLD